MVIQVRNYRPNLKTPIFNILCMTILDSNSRLGRSICSLGGVLQSASVLCSSADIYQHRTTMTINLQTNFSNPVISKKLYRRTSHNRIENYLLIIIPTRRPPESNIWLPTRLPDRRRSKSLFVSP